MPRSAGISRTGRRADMIERGVQSPAFPGAVKVFDDLLADMNSTLTDQPWLAGNDFSLADIAYLPYVLRLDHLALSGWWDDKPHLALWYERARSRPSFATGIAEWIPPGAVESMQQHGAGAWPVVKEIIAS